MNKRNNVRKTLIHFSNTIKNLGIERGVYKLYILKKKQ